MVWYGPVNVNLMVVAMCYGEVYRAAPCEAFCQELSEI